ncbi:MAG: DUF4367 domain-containing protein [Oscillospiraceae bacterium]|nr:DUF4367 domain-containing protein [Oscillospiraceae bacterium]
MAKNCIDETRSRYPNLENLSLDELQTLIRQDFYSTECTDMDYIAAILEVMEKKEAENPNHVPIDVKAAWKDFEENYIGKESAYLHLLPADEIFEAKPSVSKSTATRRRSPVKLARIAAIVVMAVMFLGVFTAQALGHNVFQSIAQWTSDVFTFGGSGGEVETGPLFLENPYDRQYKSLQDVIDEIGVTVSVIPTWYPEGFVQTQLNVVAFYERVMIHALFEQEENALTIAVIINYAPVYGSVFFHEKDDRTVEEYRSHGIAHYIMTNYDRAVAVWLNEYAEVSIQGDISETYLRKMITSIYEPF